MENNKSVIYNNQCKTTVYDQGVETFFLLLILPQAFFLLLILLDMLVEREDLLIFHLHPKLYTPHGYRTVFRLLEPLRFLHKAKSLNLDILQKYSTGFAAEFAASRSVSIVVFR